MDHILFVCSANKDRSKTAEDHFSEKYPGFYFLSAGTNQKICEQEGTSFLTDDMLDWASRVYVMEEKHRQWIKTHFKHNYGQKIVVLNIPDVYQYFQKELIVLLDQKLAGKFIP